MVAEKKEIGKLGPHDVLLGRGTGPNESIGNIRFRAMVHVIIEQSGISKLDRFTKAILAEVIIARIKENGGKFLKKVNPGSKVINAANGETTNEYAIEGFYQEVSALIAADKVKQSLRHHFRTLRPRNMPRSIPSTKDVSAKTIMVRPSSSQPPAPPHYRLSPLVVGSWPTAALFCSLSDTPHTLLSTLSPGVDAYLKSTTADFKLAHMADALQVRYDPDTADRLNDRLAAAIAPVPAVPPLIAKDNIALQLLKRQELALLRDSLVRQFDEQNYMLSTHKFLLPSLETSSGIALLLHLRSRLSSETILDAMPLL